jgi:dTDP-4-dehydrorhamnose reductase
VFDGAGHEARNEQAPCAPLNAYGESKLAGERAIAEAGGHWLVLRTSWVYGARGANFLRTMLRLAAEREHLRVVADQIGAPTSARLIADATAQILGRLLQPARDGFVRNGFVADDFESENLHLCAAGETSWHGFAEAIIDGWRCLHGTQALAVREVEPIGTKDWPTPAARPLNSRLDCSRLAERHGLTMPDWREGLGLVLGEARATLSV